MQSICCNTSALEGDVDRTRIFVVGQISRCAQQGVRCDMTTALSSHARCAPMSLKASQSRASFASRLAADFPEIAIPNRNLQQTPSFELRIAWAIHQQLHQSQRETCRPSWKLLVDLASPCVMTDLPANGFGCESCMHTID